MKTINKQLTHKTHHNFSPVAQCLANRDDNANVNLQPVKVVKLLLIEPTLVIRLR